MPKTKPKRKLTDSYIRSLPAPDPSGEPQFYWDSEITGFGLGCSGKSATKTFVAQRVVKGMKTPRRMTIERFGIIFTEQARDRAAVMLDEMRRGIDPKRKIENPTLRGALEGYLAANKKLRPASIRVYRQIERTLKDWLDKHLCDLTPEMVEDRHEKLAEEIGESTANGSMRTVRVLWNFAAERTPDLPANPVRRLKRRWYHEPRRQRMVKAEDMPKFYRAVMAMKNPIQRDYCLFLLFTGMRRTEAATLEWKDVDLRERVIRVQPIRTKTNTALNLPMSDVVRDMLVARRALGNTGFVFPGGGESGHISDAGLGAIDTATGIKVSPHDLRRTFCTVAEATDISPIALKCLINHSVGSDVTSGYVILSTERLREASQRVADRMKELCEIVPVSSGNVARL